MKGYSGKILHVNLTDGSFEVEKPSESFYRKYFGGACMGTYYVMKGLEKGVNPLGPDNIIAFTISAVTGAAISGNSRHCVTTKSPQTGTICHSESGGWWAPFLKFAGFDGVIIRGRASKPVYLWIHDGEFELRSAESIWGTPTDSAQQSIRDELGNQKIKVAQIGPSGENGVVFAAITNELKHFNGRNGVGTVMGSKNLRAIAVYGQQKPEFHDPQSIKDMAKRSAQIVAEEGPGGLKRVGTSSNVEGNTLFGGLPTRNWTMGTFEEQDNLMGEKYASEMMDKPGTCWACVQSCKRDIKEGITSPEAIDPQFGGPEYETLGMCGSNLGIGNFNQIAALNQLSSKYCVDSISFGGVIGFAMECYEKGILTREDTGGLELTFGNYEAAMELGMQIIENKDGLGALLAKGTKAAAEAIGPEAEKLAVYVKGKEFPAHMPHTKAGLGLAYAVNPFGPDHVNAEHDGSLAGDPFDERMVNFGFYKTQDPTELTLEKARLVVYSYRWTGGIDSVSMCHFIFNVWSMFGFKELMELIHAVTGWNYSIYEFMLLGERKLNMLRAFNIREGFTADDDDLPAKIFENPLEDDGPAGGRVFSREDFLKAKEYFYGMCGWDSETGVPSKYKLYDLGLEWAEEYIKDAK